MNAADVNAGITYLNLPFRSSTYHVKREDDRFTLMTIRGKEIFACRCRTAAAFRRE